MPTARAAPSRTAAMASTPDPVPTSSTKRPARSTACSARRHNRVVAWWPVPKPIEGWMTMNERLGGQGLMLGRCELGAATVGPTVMRPTVTGLRFSCDRLAQSSSSTSTGSARYRAAPSAAHAASRVVAVGKNIRRVRREVQPRWERSRRRWRASDPDRPGA